MRILITGSSGQIGTNLVLHLLDQGHDVYGVDIRPNPWTRRIETIIQDLNAPQTEFVTGIGDTTYPSDLDVVVHLAAHAKVYELVEHPERALQNISMAFNVLEFCRHQRVPIIFGSTREVYGDVQRYVTEESQADFMVAESPYAASKIAGEALVHSYARCYELPFLVFRFSNVYGRYDNDIERMERVTPLFIHRIRHGEPVTIYGAEKELDFTYVDDCIEGIAAGIDLLVRGAERDHTVNLAYGQGNSLVTLATYIGQALWKEPRIEFAPARAGEVTRYVANIGKARALLNYNPRVPLEEGIKRCVAWSVDWWERKG